MAIIVFPLYSIPFSYFPHYSSFTSSNHDDHLCPVKLRYPSTPQLLPVLLGISPLISQTTFLPHHPTTMTNCVKSNYDIHLLHCHFLHFLGDHSPLATTLHSFHIIQSRRPTVSSQSTISLYSTTTACTSWDISSNFPDYVPSTSSKLTKYTITSCISWEITLLSLPHYNELPFLSLSINCFFSFPYAHCLLGCICYSMYNITSYHITALHITSHRFISYHFLSYLVGFNTP